MLVAQCAGAGMTRGRPPGDLRAQGWITFIAGALPTAGGGRGPGRHPTRWFAVAVAGLNAVNQMFLIPAYSFWSLTIIAIDVVALWAGDGWPTGPGSLLGLPDTSLRRRVSWTTWQK